MAERKKIHQNERTPFRQELFWDVDPKTIDASRHARYVIERILDLGNLRDVQWLRGRYAEEPYFSEKKFSVKRLVKHDIIF